MPWIRTLDPWRRIVVTDLPRCVIPAGSATTHHDLHHRRLHGKPRAPVVPEPRERGAA